MSATGSFEVDLTPQEDGTAPAGRMILAKRYEGGVSGTAAGQMISKRTQAGTAVYFAVEEFIGSVDGKAGGFTLLHQGRMSTDSQSLEITILEGSGSGELATISGSMTITQDENGHQYDLDYDL